MAVAIVPEIAVSIAVPAMIVIEPAAVAFPIALEELSALIARSAPMGAGVGGTGPISVMPTIPPSHWIPIAIDPEIIGSGGSRTGMDDPRCGRWPNPHANR